MPKINPLIALGIPTWGKVSISWAQTLRHLGGPLGSNMVELSPVVGKPIAEARNELMAAAIGAGCEYLFMLGDDVMPQGDALIRLLQRMWDDPDLHMVTGMYWTKQWPTQPYIWRGAQRGPYLDWRHGEYFEVDFAGCDCLLIRLSDQVKALGPTWFSTTWTWEDTTGPNPAVPLLATEDFYFYTRARQAGLRLWCDSLVQCIHEDRNTGQQFALTTDMPQYTGGAEPKLPDGETDAAPLVKLADVGAGFEAPYFGRPDRVKVVRFDGDEKTKPDYRCDIRRLPVEDQSFDVVHSRHALEHFGRGETMAVLNEWTRILRVGGEMRLSVPNLLSAIQKVMLMEHGVIKPDQYPFWQLYGAQSDQRDFHHNGFTPRRLQLLFERTGLFEDIEVTPGDDDLNLYVKARKTKHASPFALLPAWEEIQTNEGISMPGLELDAAPDLVEDIKPQRKIEDWDDVLTRVKERGKAWVNPHLPSERGVFLSDSARPGGI